MSKQYDINSIVSKDPLEHIRLRPGMWIGSTSSEGILHLVNEVIDNSIDEFDEGRGSKINIIVDTHDIDDITISDEGNGVPVGVLDGESINTLTKVFTSVFTGGKFDDTYESDVSGMNGVGVKAVNALSSYMRVESNYNGYLYSQEFSKGKPTTDVIKNGKSKTHGLKIRFIPDQEIFGKSRLNTEDLILKCKYLSSIKPNLRINLKILDSDEVLFEQSFYETKELQLILDENGLSDNVLTSFEFKGKKVKCLFTYSPSSNSSIKSFCNNVYTRDGGYHEDAVISIITNVLKKLIGRSIQKYQVIQGLNLVLSVYKKNPIYRGQNKTRIADEEIKRMVYDTLYQPIYDLLSSSKNYLKYIDEISKAQDKAIEESSIKAAISDIKSKSRDNRIPKDLFYVSRCNPEDRELIIVEGKSAAGSVAKARNPKFQEVLPLRGKIINMFKYGLTESLKNAEVRDIFLSVGGMEGSNTKLRAHKVLILVDRDSDGAHISTLIESLFVIAFPSFIRDHELYIVDTPLFCATDGKRRAYGKNARSAGAEFRRLYNSQNFYIQRNKGIGEISPIELRQFIDPKTRNIRRVTLGENSRDKMDQLMGVDSSYRHMILNEVDEDIYMKSLIEDEEETEL